MCREQMGTAHIRINPTFNAQRHVRVARLLKSPSHRLIFHHLDCQDFGNFSRKQPHTATMKEQLLSRYMWIKIASWQPKESKANKSQQKPTQRTLRHSSTFLGSSIRPEGNLTTDKQQVLLALSATKREEKVGYIFR